MASNLVIDRAVASDLPEIVALVNSAYEPYVERIGKKPAPMNADYSAIVAEGRATVARAHHVVGLVVIAVHDEYVMIENVAVSPAFQGRGLGAALLREAEDQARAAGLREVRLYTNEKMTENLAYYPRQGYRITGQREEDGYTRVYFARTLPSG